MKNTGALLKSKRESSSLSLSEVALATKINPKILAAIENGDEKNLPAKTFLKGFVRSYALFLKMDVDSVMRSFQEETGGPPPAAPVAPIETARPAKPGKNEPSASATRRRVGDESSSGLRTVAVVVIVVLIGLIIGVRELIEKYQRERVVEASADLNKATPVVAVPVTEAAPETVAPATSPTVAATPDVAPDTGDVVTIESATVPPTAKTVDTKAAQVVKPVEVKAPGTKVTETKMAETKPTEERPSEPNPPVATKDSISPPSAILSRRTDLVRVPVNNFVELRPIELVPPHESKSSEAPKNSGVRSEEPKAAAEVKPEVKAEVKLETKPEVKPDAVKAEEIPAVVNAAKNEIILEALDKVEVKFQVKGETKRVSLAPSQVHTIHAELPMTLDLSDGGAVNIILNGRERGVPGDLGKPKTIKIP